MFTFITIPQATTTLTSLGEWSKVIFDELFPIFIIPAGIIIGAFLVNYFFGTAVEAFVKTFWKDK